MNVLYFCMATLSSKLYNEVHVFYSSQLQTYNSELTLPNPNGARS